MKSRVIDTSSMVGRQSVIYSGRVIGTERKGKKRKSDQIDPEHVKCVNDTSNQTEDTTPNKKFKTNTSKNVNLNVARTETLKLNDKESIETYFSSYFKTTPLYVVDLFSTPCMDIEHGRMESEMKLILRSVIKKRGYKKPGVGCIAWISDEHIIHEMSICEGVALIVNREDYEVWGNGCAKKRYPKLKKMPKPMHVMFGHLGGVMLNVDTHIKNGHSSLYPVRAFGNNSSNAPKKKKNVNEDGYGGLEHCKYFIMFEYGYKIRQKYEKYGRSMDFVLGKNKKFKYVLEHWGDDLLYPFRVWTGSMNFTGNAKNNHDNAQIHVGIDVGLNFYYDWSVTYITSTPVFSKTKTSTPMLNVVK
jgi:hypothetical protein